MTPEPQEVSEAPEQQQEGLQLDIKHYVAALERKNAQLLRENTALDAVIAQISEERDNAINALEEAMKKPQHNGRTTAPKPRKPQGRKTSG